MKKNIGIYSGTFDPIHAGHIAFALEAARSAKLDSVFFLLERTPRHKPHATPYELRIDHVKTALVPHAQLEVLELPDMQLSVLQTLPEIEKQSPMATYHMLIGSDVVTHLHTWPDIEALLQRWRLVIGNRTSDDEAATKEAIGSLGASARTSFVTTAQSHLSSSMFRNS